MLQAVIHQFPHPQGPHFLILCLISAHCPLRCHPGAEQGVPRYPGWVVFVNPPSPRCQGELLRVQSVAVAASSCHHSMVFGPKGMMQGVQFTLDSTVGAAAIPAVPAVPTCAAPAACAQQELSCIAFLAGCSVCKKIRCQQGLALLSRRRQKDKSSSFSALFTCYSFLFQALQQTAMKLLDIHKQKSGLLCTDIDQEGQSVC